MLRFSSGLFSVLSRRLLFLWSFPATDFLGEKKKKGGGKEKKNIAKLKEDRISVKKVTVVGRRWQWKKKSRRKERIFGNFLEKESCFVKTKKKENKNGKEPKDDGKKVA